MVISKAFETLIKKPVILLMSVGISVLPVVLGIAIAGGAEDAAAYTGIVLLFTAICTFVFVGPMAMYTYQVCNGSIARGWFGKGFIEKSPKIIVAVILARGVQYIVGSMGTVGAIYLCFTFMAIQIAAIAFEGVCKVSIAAGDDFTDAVDYAVSVTKGIYIKVGILVFVLSIIQRTLLYGAGDVVQGLYSAFTGAIILIYCTHHFVEDKQITDAAMERLNDYDSPKYY